MSLFYVFVNSKRRNLQQLIDKWVESLGLSRVVKIHSSPVQVLTEDKRCHSHPIFHKEC